MNVNISHWSSKEIVEIPISLIMDSDLSDGAKITLTYLLSYKGYGGLSVSQARVADDLDKSRYLISKQYLELERYGYIILKRVKGASSEIILTRKSVQND